MKTLKSLIAGLLFIALAVSARSQSAVQSTTLKHEAVGVFCLPPGQAGAGTPSKYFLKDMIADDCWVNPNISGLSLRSFWSLIEPADGVYDWSYFDQAVVLAKRNHKLLAIGVTPGEFSPPWVYAAGAQKIQYDKDKKEGHVKTIVAVLPWDPIFLQKWSEFVRAFGQRYDSVAEVAYVTTGGLGRQSETIYADSPESIALFNQLAPGGNGDAAWVEAGKQILEVYAKSFPSTPFINASSPPTTNAEGREAQMVILNWAAAANGPRFGLKSCALTPTSYSLDAMPAQKIAALTKSGAPSGYQMFLPQRAMKGTLQETLDNGIRLQGQFLEVYKGDCSDPRQASVLEAANTRLLKMYGASEENKAGSR